jgi:hypothetical protein
VRAHAASRSRACRTVGCVSVGAGGSTPSMPAYPAWPHPTALGFHSEWRVAERRTGRERMDSPTLQTLKDLVAFQPFLGQDTRSHCI